MTDAPKYDCLCAGILVADHVCDPIEHMPQAGELVLSKRLSLSIGGCAANVAVDLAKLERRIGVVGVIGRDIFGRFVREFLEDSGVTCEALVESETEQTSGTLIVNVRGEDRRFIHSVGANAEFTAKEIDAELLKQCRVLYLGGYCLSESLTAENVAALFRQAQQLGVTTLLDVVIPQPGDYWPRIEPVLKYTDVFFPNEDESRAITGLVDPLTQAKKFHDAGAKTAVVTCGGGGAILVNDEGAVRAGSFEVEFVDGTGSGDAFVAGFIHGLLEGADVKRCLEYGSALGASCVRAIGATTGIFRPDELREFLSRQKIPLARVTDM